jgi:hypothetical protein
MLRLWGDVISGLRPHSPWRIGQKKPPLVARDEMMPAISRRSNQKWNHLTRMLASLLPQFCGQQVGNPV